MVVDWASVLIGKNGNFLITGIFYTDFSNLSWNILRFIISKYWSSNLIPRCISRINWSASMIHVIWSRPSYACGVSELEHCQESGGMLSDVSFHDYVVNCRLRWRWDLRSWSSIKLIFCTLPVMSVIWVLSWPWEPVGYITVSVWSRYFESLSLDLGGSCCVALVTMKSEGWVWR